MLRILNRLLGDFARHPRHRHRQREEDHNVQHELVRQTVVHDKGRQAADDDGRVALLDVRRFAEVEDLHEHAAHG